MSSRSPEGRSPIGFLAYSHRDEDHVWVAELRRRLQHDADELCQRLAPSVAHSGWHELLDQAQTQSSALIEQAAASFFSAANKAQWQELVDLIQAQVSACVDPPSASSSTTTEAFANASGILFPTVVPPISASVEAFWPQIEYYDRLDELFEQGIRSKLRVREVFGQHLRAFRRRLRSIYGSVAATCQRRCCALAGRNLTRIVHRPRSACRTVTASPSADDDDASPSFPHHRALGLDWKGRQRGQQERNTQDQQSPRSPATPRSGRPSMAWHAAGRRRSSALQVLDPARRRPRGSAWRRGAGDAVGPRQVPRSRSAVIDQRHLPVHPRSARPAASRGALSHGAVR